MTKMDNTFKYVSLLEEAETLLYSGIEALESADLIQVRQCVNRVNAAVIEAWQIQQQESRS